MSKEKSKRGSAQVKDMMKRMRALLSKRLDEASQGGRHTIQPQRKNGHLSLFEKVILVNSMMLIGEALAALWVTSHQLEVHHYLIDTIFIVMATLFTLFANIILLRASFRPLFVLLKTIRAVSAGQTQERAQIDAETWEINELAQSFNSMLDRLEAARRERTQAILQAQENERRRIGMELHDEAGQNLTALLIHTEILHQHFQDLSTSDLTEKARNQLDSELQQLNRLTRLSLENVRVLAQQLRPSVLDDLGLLAAFRWLGEDAAQRLHLQVELDLQQIEPVVKILPASYETALFRIAQESLTNVARHAQAQSVLISLRPKHEHIYLTIQDDGIGYQAGEAKAGMGILGMRERATSLGGTLNISGHSQQGTTVQAVLSMPSPPAQQPQTIASRKEDKG